MKDLKRLRGLLMCECPIKEVLMTGGGAKE